ncbi:MAG: hypothetical protein JW915_21485, partial [Chitinispirillaceae bacterium]|nr:hypothetical protein [Chitinispirillaceae bacterium]
MRKTIHSLLVLLIIANCGGSYKLKQVMNCKADKIGITFRLYPSNSRVKECGNDLVKKKIWVNDINKIKVLCHIFSDKQVPPKICGH